jgi:hypothetical protein
MQDIVALLSGKSVAEKREITDKVGSLILEGKIPINKISLKSVAEGLFGREYMRKVEQSSSRPLVVSEAADPVASKAFLNISGNLVYQGVVEAYNSPTLIGSQLVTEETSTEDNTREIGIAPIDDRDTIVPEFEEYRDVKFGEDYIDIPKSDKRGMKIAITKEAVFFDRTGLVIEQARSIGERLAVTKEIQILQVVMGVNNTFSRKGVSVNTYLTSGNRINEKSGLPITDWTSFSKAEMMFDAMRDDRKNPEPIMVMPNAILVPKAKVWDTKRILNATEVRTTTGTTQTNGANPIGNGMTVLTSPWITSILQNSATATGVDKGLGLTATQAENYWFMGDFKKAFRYRTLFPLQVVAAGPNNDADFERDVVAQFRASMRGVAYVRAPWNSLRLYDT